MTGILKHIYMQTQVHKHMPAYTHVTHTIRLTHTHTHNVQNSLRLRAPVPQTLECDANDGN